MEKKNRSLRLTLLAAGIALASSAQAVEISTSGLGQALVFPYYTVDGGAQTTITVTNSTGVGKALQVAFREGSNGRLVLDFNLYLGPHDSWTGALFSLDAAGAANLVTTDSSCTVPAIRTATTLPQVGGNRYVPFRNGGYAGQQGDGGSAALARTREGTIEVIEMATIVPGTPSAAALAPDASGVPAGCGSLVAAWTTGGYWDASAGRDVANPNGGLSGTAAVVDVANGTMVQYAATALEDFRVDGSVGATATSAAIHSPPGDGRPNLADALSFVSDPLANPPTGAVTATRGGRTFTYPAARAIDAVSALLASASIVNEYIVGDGLGAATDWVVTFPTKRYYTDAAVVGATAITPFEQVFGASGSCSSVDVSAFTRDGVAAACGTGTGTTCAVDLCNVVNVVAFGGAAQRSPVLDSARVVTLPVSGAGHAEIGLDDPAYTLRGDAAGATLRGLPVLGFAATSVVNASAQPGLLANYAAGLPHRATAAECASGPCD